MENLENLLSLPGSWALPCLDIISYVAIAAFWHGHLTQDIQGNWRCQGRHLVMPLEDGGRAVVPPKWQQEFQPWRA